MHWHEIKKVKWIIRIYFLDIEYLILLVEHWTSCYYNSCQEVWERGSFVGFWISKFIISKTWIFWHQFKNPKKGNILSIVQNESFQLFVYKCSSCVLFTIIVWLQCVSQWMVKSFTIFKAKIFKHLGLFLAFFLSEWFSLSWSGGFRCCSMWCSTSVIVVD